MAGVTTSTATASLVTAERSGPGPGWSLAAALLGFFVVTLDAVIVNVALPRISTDLHSSMSGLQWVVDSYTLMFAALLLSSGSLSDRVGARRAFGAGMAVTRPRSIGQAKSSPCWALAASPTAPSRPAQRGSVPPGCSPRSGLPSSPWPGSSPSKPGDGTR